MMLKIKQVALASAFILSGLPVLAEDIALVIGNTDYRYQPTAHGANRVLDTKNALEATGFRVFYGVNQNKVGQSRLATEFLQSVDEADRAVVFISGHIATSARDSWLLAIDARDPSIFTVGEVGLSLGGLMDVLAQKPGSAILAIGKTNERSYLGDWLTSDVSDMSVPQGVTFIHGPTQDVVSYMNSVALVPGHAMGPAPRRTVISGYVVHNKPFLSGRLSESEQPSRPGDRAYWEAVKSIGTVQAYKTYIERYPDGYYYREAKRAIAELHTSPERKAQESETRLGLNRTQRRQIQRNLTILGFNTRGIDGVLGRGSRAAIGAWQQSRGIEGYGYLTGNQISALQRLSEARSLELQEEAHRRQLEQEQHDTNYWRKTGRNGSEAQLRAYLIRYPDGIYSDVAKQKLRRIANTRRNDATEAELGLWDQIRSNNTRRGYERYLSIYPNGLFVRDAKEKLGILQNSSQADELTRRLMAAEKKLVGNSIARLLVEKKLHALGLKPGRVDGEFDSNTRRALRQFQRSRKMKATGYIDQSTAVQLLASSNR